jgi:hypothetical protein
MDQQPYHEEGLPTDEAARAAEFERLVEDGIEQALREDRRIDDLTAKRIAQELDPGSGPLHEFAETGAIPEDIETDLAMAEEVLRDLELERHIPWITALGGYLAGRPIKTEMPFWNDPSME